MDFTLRSGGQTIITITSEFNSAKVFTDTLETGAEEQIKKMLDQTFTAGSQIRVMSDVHAGFNLILIPSKNMPWIVEDFLCHARTAAAAGCRPHRQRTKCGAKKTDKTWYIFTWEQYER